MSKFIPYANEADVLQICGMQIENRLDRITLSGDVDLTADQAGLDCARALLAVLADAVALLEARDLPKKLPPAASTTVKNPFA